MAGFSAKERFIAKALNAVPGIKQLVKKLYIRANAIWHKKNYTEKVFLDKGSIKTVWNGDEESFFGYYDKSPTNSRGDVLVHLSDYNTKNIPTANHRIKIAVVYHNGEQEIIGVTSSYNWQQGARAMWINNDLVMYNAFENDRYVAVVYSLTEKRIIKTFVRPVQESCGTNYFLSINYRRIMAVRPDYGYRNLPPLSDTEIRSFDDAGIIKVDYATGKETVLHSMEEIVNVSAKKTFDNCAHVVNHLMLSPDATGFVFVHRYFEGKRRHDRLMYSNGSTLKCLLDDDMVSHYCWIDNARLFGYVRVSGKDGFYIININSGEIVACDALNNLNYGDGHPTHCNGSIIVDTYPDKSRMQHLMILNLGTSQVNQLLEVFQSVKYINETRCDMHPRFSRDGSLVFFDTVYSGKRQLCYIKLK